MTIPAAAKYALWTMAALTVVNNVPALAPVKKIVSGESGWFS